MLKQCNWPALMYSSDDKCSHCGTLL